jgi:hypothetical protein
MTNKRLFIGWVLAVMSCTWAATAQAGIVDFGSSYSVYLRGQTSLAQTYWTASFDGVTESITRSGLNLSLSETETSLGGGRSLITINITTPSGGDLFPVTGESAIWGLGVDGNGLDLLQAVHLEDARTTLTWVGDSWTTANLADDYRSTHFQDPWTGLYPANNVAFSSGNIGGRGTYSVTYAFTVSQIPEPGTLALLGLSLVGLVASRRRKRTS